MRVCEHRQWPRGQVFQQAKKNFSKLKKTLKNCVKNLAKEGI